MNTKNILRRGFSIIGIMLIYGISISSQAGGISIAIIPPTPTDHEIILVAVYGVEGDSCVPKNAQVSSSENVIHVDFPPPDGAGCLTSFTPWGELVWLDRELPEGAYDVIVTRGEVERGRRSFRVQNPPSTSTSIKIQQVTCNNLTTGKKKVIKNPSSSWNCEAAGLKVHPGDKIERILLGTAKKKM